MLKLNEEEYETLKRWARRPTTAQALAQRARIVLACATGKSNTDVAREMYLTKQCIGKWRSRFVSKRLDGLLDEPRPGAPRTISDAKVERTVTLTLESTPTAATHWSIRSMAKQCGLSRSTVQRIWRAFALQPHRSETFKLSTDPLFIEKVRDIVGLYLNPPERALVLCADEKSQIQASIAPNPTAYVTRLRNATLTITSATAPPLFAAPMPRLAKSSASYIAIEPQSFAIFDTIEGNVPKLQVHLILDNYATHKTALIHRWLAKHPRFHLHFTPTSGSWLNLVERWFALLTERQIKRGVHRSTQALENAIHHYLKFTNENPKPFIWTKTADEILASVARFCQRTSGSGH
jgi:transposase